MPSVQVIIPTRERRALLADALASVAAQSALPDRIVICDVGQGGPLDPPTILAGRIVHLPSRAATIGSQRNEAAAAGTCEWIAFLDDDDRWRPDHLAGLLEACRDASVHFAYRDTAVVRERIEHGARVTLEERVIARDWDQELMRTHDYIAPSAWCVRRFLFESLGGFDPDFRYSDDWDFLMRLGGRTVPRRVPGIGAEIRMRETDNASREMGETRRADLRRLEARHGLSDLEPLTFWEVAEVVGRRPLIT